MKQTPLNPRRRKGPCSVRATGQLESLPPIPALESLKAYLQAQPRRVRFFSEELELLWCNRTDEDANEWCFAGEQSHRAIPPKGLERDRWPVSLILNGLSSASRLYSGPNPENGNGDGRRPSWKVVAWPFVTEQGLVVVEETEPVVAPEESGIAIRQLDQDIEDLLHDVFAHFHHGTDSGPLRLPNPYLVKCREQRVCTNKSCPAYNNPTVERCWEVTAFKTTGPNGQIDILSKFHSCSQCHVFDEASPDSMTRISENFNRLISLLQLKYQETLDVQHRMQQADKLAIMGELLAGIAHEIKNPLGIIIGRLDVIGLEMETMDQEVLSEDIATIYQQANRVRHIIDHLLAMARPEPPSFKPIHMNTVVMDSLEMVRKTLAEKRIRTRLNLQSKLPAIHADQIQMQQVLLNLVLNARDAMPADGTLTITTRLDTGTPNGLEVMVADDGEGIPPHVLQRLFSSFQTTKLGKGGTGLGLAVCRRIMELHNGKISAESIERQGTTMRLWFPLKGYER